MFERFAAPGPPEAAGVVGTLPRALRPVALPLLVTSYNSALRGPAVLSSPLPLAAAGILGALLVGVLAARNTNLAVAAVIGACYAPIVFPNLPLGVVIWAPLAFFNGCRSPEADRLWS